MQKRVPVWQSSARSRFDLATFLRRHNRILSFVGALIVFLTFVIKEGLREHLRSLADALGSAQNIFRLRNENAQMLGLLERIVVVEGVERGNGNEASDSCKNRSGVFYGNPHGLNPYASMGVGGGYPGNLYVANGFGMGMGLAGYTGLAGGSGGGFGGYGYGAGGYLGGLGSAASIVSTEGNVGNAKFYVNADQLLMVDAELDDMHHFIQELPDRTARARNLDAFFTKSVTYHREYAKSEDACKTEPSETDKMTTALSSDVQKYAAEMLISAESLKAQAERRYQICTWASYVLYTFGWGLGLIGKLYSGSGLNVIE